MELKVVCPCGQKFKFDVEPVNGQMPFTVTCPLCGADGTATANQMLAAMFASPPPPATPPPPPPPAPVSGGLRLSKSAHSEPAPAPATAPDAAPANPAMAPAMVGAAARAAHLAAQPAPKQTSFGKGLLGGLIGAVVGTLVYFLVYKFTGSPVKLLAIGVGALAGWLAELMGKGEGSKELGGITAVFVLCGILGAQYFVALGWWHEIMEEDIREQATYYTNSVAEAKEVVKAIPTGSEFEIRNYLAKQYSKDGEKLMPGQIPADEVKEFHDTQLPEFQGLASGSVTREQYEQQHHLKTSLTKEEKQEEENTFKGVFLLLLLSKVNLFSLAAAAGLAFKLSTNAD